MVFFFFSDQKEDDRQIVKLFQQNSDKYLYKKSLSFDPFGCTNQNTRIFYNMVGAMAAGGLITSTKALFDHKNVVYTLCYTKMYIC